MNRLYVLFFVTVALGAMLGLIVACQPVQPVVASGCSPAMLKGTYGSLGHGQVLTTTDPVVDPLGPFAGLGPLAFDGIGKFDLVATFSLNGTILRGIPMTGTYTVNANCTGELLLGNIAPYDIVIVDHGREMYGIAAIPGRVYTFTGKKID